MSEDRNGRFDWRTILVTAAIIIGQGAVQYGIISAKMEEYSRRIESLEKKMDDRTLSRDEFEKRHAEVERRIQELERKVR